MNERRTERQWAYSRDGATVAFRALAGGKVNVEVVRDGQLTVEAQLTHAEFVRIAAAVVRDANRLCEETGQ